VQLGQQFQGVGHVGMALAEPSPLDGQHLLDRPYRFGQLALLP
jgi:hypothetical protein